MGVPLVILICADILIGPFSLTCASTQAVGGEKVLVQFSSSLLPAVQSKKRHVKASGQVYQSHFHM